MDLAGFSLVRFVVRRMSQAAAAGSVINLKYSFTDPAAAFSAAAWSSIPAQLSLATLNITLDTGWIAMPAGMQANNVFLAVTQAGGDGTQSPVIGSVRAYFKTSGPLLNGIDQATADARYVNITGDTMTGDLLFPGNHKIGGSGAYFNIQPNLPTDAIHVGSHRIAFVSDPNVAQDAATKNYVDNGDNAIYNMISQNLVEYMTNASVISWGTGVNTSTSVARAQKDYNWVHLYVQVILTVSNGGTVNFPAGVLVPALRPSISPQMSCISYPNYTACRVQLLVDGTLQIIGTAVPASQTQYWVDVSYPML
jgi:hypothetical protein